MLHLFRRTVHSLLIMVGMFLLLSGSAFGQESDDSDLMAMSLEDLLNMEITVATGEGKKLSPRETPAIVTVITKEEIRKTGMRNLFDILRMTPGFEFAGDIWGVVGYGTRGIFASEGKILIMVDGIPFNDHLYGYPYFADQFFAETIEKVEIIRGPGSAIYGGFAELAVVNIITDKSDAQDGLELGGTLGTYADAGSPSGVFTRFYKKMNFFDVDLKLGYKEGAFSDRVFTNYNGTDFELGDRNQITAWTANLALKGERFTIRYLTNDLGSEYPFPDQDDNISLEETFIHRNLDARVTLLQNEKWNVQLRGMYTALDSWNNDDANSIEQGIPFKVLTKRYFGNLTANLKASEKLDLTFGTEYYFEEGKIPDEPEQSFIFEEGKTKIDYNNLSGFLQMYLKTNVANVTLGGRFDNHSQVGSVFVPRAAMTKAWEKTHIKILASEAYRAPTLYNIQINPEIEPEETTVLEVELGYRFNPENILVANVFDTRIEDAIIYEYFAETDEDNYFNASKTGTQGIELEFNSVNEWGRIKTSYSYYQVNTTESETYWAYDENGNRQEDAHIGFPQHKLTGYLTYDFTPKFTVSPSFIYTSGRYGYSWLSENYYTKSDAKLFLNVAATFRHLLPGLEVQLSAHDLTDEGYDLGQALDHGYEPTLGPGRDLRLLVRYRNALH